MKKDALLFLVCLVLMQLFAGCEKNNSNQNNSAELTAFENNSITREQKLETTQQEENTSPNYDNNQDYGVCYDDYIDVSEVIADKEHVTYVLCDNGTFVQDKIFVTSEGGVLEGYYDDKWDSVYNHVEIDNPNVGVFDDAIEIKKEGTKLENKWLEIKTLPSGKYRYIKSVYTMSNKDDGYENFYNTKGFVTVEFVIK